MERQAVTSGTIASVGYDEATATLEIEFVKGTIYQYLMSNGAKRLMTSSLHAPRCVHPSNRGGSWSANNRPGADETRESAVESPGGVVTGVG